VSFFLALAEESSNARIACSRRSESGGGVKKSEQEKTARDKVGVGNEGGRNPPLSRFLPSASLCSGIIQNINKEGQSTSLQQLEFLTYVGFLETSHC